MAKLLAFYLFAMAALIALLIALLVLAFAVTRGSGAYPVLGREYDEYRLDGFSMWLPGTSTPPGGRGSGPASPSLTPARSSPDRPATSLPTSSTSPASRRSRYVLL